MKFEKPETFMGIPIKGAYAKLIQEEEEKERGKAAKPVKTAKSVSKQAKSKPSAVQLKPFTPQVTAKINLSDFIQIPQYNILIRKEEEFKGINWKNTHFKLGENGLYMPRIDHFTAHYLNVRYAASGKVTIHDGNGNPIKKSEAKDLWLYLSTDHKNGCWTWLDALFKKEQGKLYLETDHRIVLNGNKKDIQGKSAPLEKCVKDECYVKLDFNSQGLPTQKSKASDYSQGKNIYFFPPSDGSVAWFLAVSDWAFLYCYNVPAYAYGGLGVFSCAEGAVAQKNNKTK